jgi:formamidopyrimidine-DNA glycosylase
MSELPEIKVMRRQIINNIISKKIVDFKVDDFDLRNGQLSTFKKKLTSSRIKDIYVFGKSLVFKLSSSYYILVNMQSTGFFHYIKKDLDVEYIRSEIIFSDKSKLLFIDQRGYSYFQLLNQKQFNKQLLVLGVDPLSKTFDYGRFLDLLRRRTTGIKNLLVNQKAILGIGNIYGDEISFDARIRPDRGIKTLKTAEIKRLYKSMGKILKKSLEYDGLSRYLPMSKKKIRFDRFLRVYGREGNNCWRCKSGKIVKQKTGNSYSYFCPLCQN